ncbi:MAG: FAD-dependent oxidoreductase [Myxococcota bacterium]
MFKILIVGAGPSGLISGYTLSRLGHSVKIVEKSDRVGGLLNTRNIDGIEIEEVYHHILYNDVHLVKLIKGLNLENRLHWYRSRVGIFTHNQFYNITTPFDYLGLSFISPLNRIKLIYRLAFPEANVSSLREFFSPEIYDSFIEDMLINKFNRYAEKINPDWFIQKLRKRGRSRCVLYERLGYIDGSFKIFCDAMTRFLESNGGEIILNSSIKSITYNGNQFKVDIDGKVEVFDRIIFTIAPPVIAELLKDIDPHFYKRLIKLSFMSNITILLYTRRNLTEYYWLNIADKKVGLTGIISQSNLVRYENVKGFFTYISLYLPIDDQMNNFDSNAMMDYLLSELDKMNINLHKSDIIEYQITKTEYAQPLYFGEEDLLTIDLKTPIKGIFILNSHSLLPEDRGLNNICLKAKLLSRIISF